MFFIFPHKKITEKKIFNKTLNFKDRKNFV